MNLAFSTLGCPDYTFEEIIKCAEKYGVSGIEIRGINSAMEADKIEEFVDADKTKALIKKQGLTITDFGTSCAFHDDTGYDQAVREGRSAVDVCERMEIPYIRVFGNDITDCREAVIKNIIRGIGGLCEYAKDKNVGILLETHGDFATVENLCPVVEALKEHENFGILWDVEHSDKAYGDNWQEFYNYIGPYVKHVHLKDYKRAKEGKPFVLTLAGKGDIPLAHIVRTLLADGYTGYFSLEWEKKWKPELPEFTVAMDSFVETMNKI